MEQTHDDDDDDDARIEEVWGGWEGTAMKARRSYMDPVWISI